MFNVVKRFFFFFSPFLFTKDAFRARSDLPDLSEDELVPAEPAKSSVLSFKHKNDSDLFGLGFEEKSVKSKDSSDEQDGKSSSCSTTFHFLFRFFFFFNPYLVWSGKCQGLSQVLSVLQKRKASTPRKKRRKRRRRVKRWNEGSVCFCLYAGADSRNKP